ncbi:hypothetical protein PHO31112_02513 [Pandoraea horticolens]|uniref:Uncharacterized protein n=1 Tax=Pandoraea horticolens TaxID=2508298 RepID=A0A5E4VAF1_9BURK|nr:hypothetical protein PHO31112_02513 [Pandoraea horticolens]
MNTNHYTYRLTRSPEDALDGIRKVVTEGATCWQAAKKWRNGSPSIATAGNFAYVFPLRCIVRG